MFPRFLILGHFFSGLKLAAVWGQGRVGKAAVVGVSSLLLAWATSCYAAVAVSCKSAPPPSHQVASSLCSPLLQLPSPLCNEGSTDAVEQQVLPQRRVQRRGWAAQYSPMGLIPPCQIGSFRNPDPAHNICHIHFYSLHFPITVTECPGVVLLVQDCCGLVWSLKVPLEARTSLVCRARRDSKFLLTLRPWHFGPSPFHSPDSKG